MDEKEARELNKMVAERVMGWRKWNHEEGDWEGPDDATFFADWGDNYLSVYEPSDDGDVSFTFAPSVEIADAWMIAEKLKGFSIARTVDGQWTCWHWDKVHRHGVGETAPLAICRAALDSFTEVD